MNKSFIDLFLRVGFVAVLVTFLYSGTAMSAPFQCQNNLVRSFPMKPPVKQSEVMKNTFLRGPDADLLNLRLEPAQKSNGKKSAPSVRKASSKNLNGNQK
jgi:hypothetical protein